MNSNRWKKAALIGALGATLGSPLNSTLAPRPALAQNAGISVLLNGTPINFGNVQPERIGGRVMVPLRGVFEALGASVDFDPATNTIYAARESTQIQLRIGSTLAQVNGQARTLDVPAQIRMNRTLVPLRFVSEALGADVRWSESLSTVYILSATTPALPPFTPPVVPVTPPVQPPVTPPVVPPVTPPVQPPVTPPTTPYTPPADNPGILATVVKVDAAPPATLTLRVENRLRPLAVDNNVQVFRQTALLAAGNASPVYGPAVPLADISRLVPNEEVRVEIDAQNEVTQVTSLVMMASARVRLAQGNRIVLEDARGTTLTIGPSLRFIDARGRVQANANIQPGTAIALFIAPTTRRIYQVSAFNADVAAATNPTYIPPDDNNTFPPTNQNNFPPDNNNPPNNNPNNNGAGAPVINSVTQTAVRPLRTGATFTVTVRGTPGVRGSFSAVAGAPEQPLIERDDQPGVYTGTYVVRAGDNILNGRVTAFLRDDDGQEASLQSRTALTIDTRAPRITSTSPSNGEAIDNNQPNIVIEATDLGGSGIAKASASINGVPVATEDITISPRSVSFVPSQPLTGTVRVNVSVADAANNSVSTTFNFTVGGNANGDDNPIASVTHNATRPLQGGERVQVNAVAPAGGRATFDLLGNNDRIVAQRLPMTEVSPGRYRGNYTIQANTTDAELRVRVRFVDVDGRSYTQDAAAPVELTAATTDAQNVTITVPGNADRVATPLTIRGTATPNATVEVSVRAEGVRYYVFEYKNELGSQQTQANTRGDWVTAPIDLPKPNNVTGLKYIISAVEIDDAGNRSEPVTVTVTSR